jgi:hypothetical protein
MTQEERFSESPNKLMAAYIIIQGQENTKGDTENKSYIKDLREVRHDTNQTKHASSNISKSHWKKDTTIKRNSINKFLSIHGVLPL